MWYDLDLRFFVQYSSRTPELYGTTSPDQRYFCDACQPEVFDHVEIFAEYLYGCMSNLNRLSSPIIYSR